MTAKPDTWMPLYVGDYLRDTRRLTLEEHGAYLLLIMEYWINGPLPDDDARLARIVGCSLDAWCNASGNASSNAPGIPQACLRASLEHFFTIKGGVWRHKRIDAERDTANRNVEARKSKAKAGAEARWGKAQNATGNAPSNATSNTPGNARRNAPSPSPSPVDITTSDEVVADSTESAPRIPDQNQTVSAQHFFDAYNAVALKCDLPIAVHLTPARRRSINARIRGLTLDHIATVFTNLEKSSFCLGQNEKNWKADLDFVIAHKAFNRLLEGTYNDLA